MKIEAVKFPYRYMEYEKDFLKNEIRALLPNALVVEKGDRIIIDAVDESEISILKRLTYIQYLIINGEKQFTLQGLLESEDGSQKNRQHTRYSTHGIHEYKGKFNPQIVHYLLNYFNVSGEQKVLDPFNGSGTTILECAHMGITAVGIDINPMACFIANAKVKSLGIDVAKASEILSLIRANQNQEYEIISNDSRMEYLLRWIPEDTLLKLERIRNTVTAYEDCYQKFFLMIASDLIREYSNQEPGDLRIRNRISPFPEQPFFDAFVEHTEKLLNKIRKAQAALNCIQLSNYALNCDIKQYVLNKDEMFDIAITSPPYATALPYIDTQRISLVWLNLCSPAELSTLEASLIGSRELLLGEKGQWKISFENNSNGLPDEIYLLINEMNEFLTETDGFRKKAVPVLLYRYFSDMKMMFENVLPMIKIGGKYALIVGRNKTTLGGQEFFIDTPRLLSIIAEQVGWHLENIFVLQTYKRYGINSKNAINSESLIVLERKS